MELGFEETITGIIQRLDSRRKLTLQALEQGTNAEVGGWDWTRRRRTVLCSATMREDVRKLANTALVRPLMIKATEVEKTPVSLERDSGKSTQPTESDEFTPPAQLSQKYVVVPLKLRLVALVALLRSLIAKYQSTRGAKILVFLSCTDSVDFHWRLMGNTSMDGDDDSANESDSDPEHERTSDATLDTQVKATSQLLPHTSIFRLHGSLPNAARLAALRGFSISPSTDSKKPLSTSCSILLCTSLAARGLDMPMVRAVVQHDLPTEGGATEYVHRVGRTARVGKGGEAWSLVSPSEVGWVKFVEEKMRGTARDDGPSRNITLEGVAIESVLRSGFGGKGTEYEDRATQVQLASEQWVLRLKHVCPRLLLRSLSQI
jgi:ATP-dependent RNA helicase DDX31/DBP7